MKFLLNKVVILFMLALLVCGVVFFIFKPNGSNKNVNSESLTYKEGNEILVSAHRGGKGLNQYPENCIETMGFLYDKGIRIFEVDVNVSSDKILMLFHDDKLNRTSNGNGLFRKKSFDDLKKLNLVDDFGEITDYSISSFSDALEWIDNKKAIFMIDIKKTVSINDVLFEIEKNSLQEKCIIITYNLKTAKKVYELDRTLKISVPIRNEKELDWALKSGIPKENLIAFTGTRKPKKEFYDEIHKNGLTIILGTLGNLDRQAKRRGNKIYEEIAATGVDIFATDRPLAVLEFLEENNY